MFKKKTAQPTSRTRQPARPVTESFRRNNVVVSRRQQELAERQQSVTQRQVQLKKDALKRRRRIRMGAIITLALIAALLFRLRLTSVQLESNASSRLQQEAQKEYEHTIYRLFSQHTLFNQAWLLDTRAFQEAVQQKYPEVGQIEFRANPLSGSKLTVTLRFRKPIFTWRDASQNLQFVDSRGVLFTKNLDPSVATDKLIQIEDQSGSVLDAGTSVLTAQIVAFIGQLPGRVGPLFGSDAKVAKVVIPRSTREVQLQMEKFPYAIKFNASRSLEEQAGELSALLGHLKAKNTTPSAYIDLRVPGKAFYR